MPPLLSSILVLALGVVGVWGMAVGWRHRTARTIGLVPVLPVQPDPLGSALTEPIEATYVSTTTAGDWLDRVTAHDLGLRGPAVVQVFDAGVRVARTGAADLFVPVGALRAVGATDGMAGKFVGHDGIVVLTWEAPAVDSTAGTGLDTGLRTRHRADRRILLDAVTTLIETHGRREQPGTLEENL
jgi:hypothetical protein